MARNAAPAGLTPKQRRFVEEYLIDLHATDAAIRAGYSAKTARSQASRLLTNVDIQTAIATAQKRLAARLDITAERVLQEYARLAFADLRQVARWDKDGVVVHDSDALTADAAAAIAEVYEDTREMFTEEGGVRLVKKRVKLHDKKGALDSLAKHLGLFTDHEHELPDIHVHVHTARDRVRSQLLTMAQRQIEPSDAAALPDGPPGGPADRPA